MTQEIVFIKNGKYFDSVDPYYSHEETEKYVVVEGPGNTPYAFRKADFDTFEIRDMKESEP